MTSAIVIYHEELATIDRVTARETIDGPCREFTCDVASDLLSDEAASVDWDECRRREESFFTETLRPELERDPSAPVVYFGAAPIPLAVRLGHLVGSWRRVEVRLHNHARKDWRWPTETKTFKLTTTLPGGMLKSIGDAVIRLGVSQPIDVEACARLFPTPTVEIDIAAEYPEVDIVTSEMDVAMIVKSFRNALDSIAANAPNVSAIHLLAAIPVGVAFQLGAAVNPTSTPPIFLYQYNRIDTERFVQCFQLQGEAVAPLRALSEMDREKIARMRLLWQEQIFNFRKTSTKSRTPWYAALLAEIQWPKLAALPPLDSTTLPLSRITADTAVSGGFRYDPASRRWALDDRLLSSFVRRFEGSAGDAARAARLFLIHETIHHDAQRLTEYTAPQVGRFPKVLEELDYLADAYAVLNEYKFTKRWHAGDHATVGQRCAAITDVALQSFWAFDDNEPSGRMQTRRVHRYLIWYWQLLRLSHCRDEREAFRVLADRPFIELAGPRLVTSNERVYFRFDRARDRPLELGLIHDGSLRRFSDGPAAGLTNLIRGFLERNGDVVRQALNGVFDQLRS